MAEVKLSAQLRTEFGKGAARRMRRDQLVPAVLYVRGEVPEHVALPAHQTMLALREANVLFNVQLPDGSEQLAVTKDVQRDPVRQIIEHVDLLKVRKGEKIAVDIPIEIVGESAAGTICLVESQTISVEAEATNIPRFIEVNIEGLEAGSAIHAGSLALPEGSTLLSDEDQLVLAITVPREEVEEMAEGEEGEGEEGAAAAEDAKADDDEK